MKTFLTILIIFALLVFTIFVLLRRSKNDNELDDNDAEYDHCPGSDNNPCGIEVDDTPNEEEVVEEPAVPEEPAEHAEPITDSELDDGKVIEEQEIVGGEEEEISFQGCKDKEEKDINITNKYFFHIHKYTTARNRLIYCIVANAVIKGKNYEVIVNRSFYPYVTSYTQNVLDKLVEKYTPYMTVEEFLKTGSTKFDRVGDSVSLVGASLD